MGKKWPVAVAALTAIIGLGGGKSGPATTPASDDCQGRATLSDRPGVVNIDSAFGDGSLSGTGIVLTPAGEVLTNDHVVRDTTGICVSTTDRTYHADVAGMDPGHDITVLRMRDAAGLATAPLGDSSTVTPGDAVMILGNNQRGVVTRGSVTGTGRTVAVDDESHGRIEHLSGLIEVDADIPAGDSGGPMLDAQGRVVGVNVAGNHDTGYAIPINTARTIAGQLSRNARMERAW